MAEPVGPIKYFVCGGFGGLCTVVVGHPMDTVKVRLQTMSPTNPRYSGTWDCFAKTVRFEGFRGLYKGISAPLVGVAPIFAVSFFGFGLGKKMLAGDSKEPLDKPRLFLAGAFSGVFTTTVMAPGERVKCLLQVQQGQDAPRKYNGSADCVKKLYAEGGLRSVYKGTAATLLRDVPASGMYFLAYEWTKEVLAPADGSGKLGLGATIIAGGMAGVANWLIGMPADVLKSRLQTAPEGTYPRGIRDVFASLMKTEGPLALYRGLTPVMLRAFPANAACFVGFEFMLGLLKKLGL